MSDGLITDEALRELQGRLGKERVVQEPYIESVSSDTLRHMVYGLGDINTFWMDSLRSAAVGRSGRMAPIFYGVGWGGGDLRRGEGLPGVHALHAGDHWRFFDYACEGDRLSAFVGLRAVEVQPSRYAGKRVLQSRGIRFETNDGRALAECVMSIIRAERGATRTEGKYSSVELAKYSIEDLSVWDEAILSEECQGESPRYWEDVNIGDAIPKLVRGPLTKGDIIVWQMAFGGVSHTKSGKRWVEYQRRHPTTLIRDPESNVPQSVLMVHYDSAAARAVGMPAPYDIGAQRATWASVAVTNWMSDCGFLAELEVTFRGMNFIGDVTIISGSVTRKWRSESGNQFVELTLGGANQRGEETMPIRAVVALPSRKSGSVRLPLSTSELDLEGSNVSEA